MFHELEEINHKPELFGHYTAERLWAEPYRSQQMLQYHLNRHIDVSSRNHDFIEQSTKWITATFSLAQGKRVCDFGCGPGLYCSRLAQAGAEVYGLDFSSNSIEYARQQAKQNGLDVHYIQGNYLRLEPSLSQLAGSFDLIIMIMCDYCALNPEQRSQLLSNFHKLLGPKGRVLLDVYSLTAFDGKEEASSIEKNQLNHFWFEEDYYAFVNTFKYEQARVMLDKYSLYSQSGHQEVVYNWLQHFSLESLRQELKHAAFEVESVYANVNGANYNEALDQFAVVVNKA